MEEKWERENIMNIPEVSRYLMLEATEANWGMLGPFDSTGMHFSIYSDGYIQIETIYVDETCNTNTPGKWGYVPLQDFSNSSDIDWSVSISNIDRQLYKKYSLTQEEIAFIETNVKEMI